MQPSLWQRLRYAPWFVQLVVIRRCNLSCGYCNEFDKTSAPVPLETLKERVDRIKALGSFGICFTGGEPTLHPDLPALIHYARHERKFLRTGMISNGTYLTPKLIQALNQAGLQELQISIDGVQRNETTEKVLNNLRKRLDALREHATFNVIVSGVVGACPPEESFAVIAHAKQLGFRPRVLLVHGADGQVRLTPEQLQAYQQIQKSIGRHLFEPSAYRHRLITTGTAPFKCRAGSRYLYVNEFGMVHWCSQTKQYFGKPLHDYTFADLKQQFHTPKSCADRCTLGCVRSASAFDEWRGQEAPTAMTPSAAANLR